MAVGFRKRPEPDPADLTKAVIEVAAVKANARALIRRIQGALNELEATVEELPGEATDDDLPGTGEEDDAPRLDL